MLAGLCHEHDFTVFAVEFENPDPERIRWVRVAAPLRPYALLYVVFHLLAPLTYALHRLKTGCRFDLVQFVESNLPIGDISYSHFCHRAYLRQHRRDRITGVRDAFRLLAHKLAAFMEPGIYRRVRHVVAPSRGLVHEIAAEYHRQPSSMCVLPNPVDVDRMRMPPAFDRDNARAALGFTPSDLVLVFVALGHFERKGLPLMFEAMRRVNNERLRLVIVGGAVHTVRSWNDRARRSGLSSSIRFVGMQRDTRPFLWMADAFILPSHYEVFPLVSLEAAAAGLPLIVTQLNGVEEFLQNNVNGFLIDCSEAGVAEALSRVAAIPRERLREMGSRARGDVQRYATGHFVAHWRSFYNNHAILATAG